MSLYAFFNYKFNNEKIDKLYKRIFVRLANILLPYYYIISGLIVDNRIEVKENLNSSSSYIVTLTSFPLRISKVWLAIESILRQKNKPDAIILWLYKGEFPDKKSLPKRLLQQERRGLQIRFCDENIRPHKKYYYTLKEYPNANLVTIDDDIIYPSYLLKRLKNYHQKYPNCICASIVQKITINNSGLKPYKKWPHVDKNTNPSTSYLPIGAGGVLYPSHSLDPEVLNIRMVKKLALTADDLWLKLMSAKKNTKVVGIPGEYPRSFIPILIRNNRSLMQRNVEEGENDIVINNLLKYYDLSHEIFVDDGDLSGNEFNN